MLNIKIFYSKILTKNKNKMKKIILNYLIIVTLVCSAAFTSCISKGSDAVKLLEIMTKESPDYVFTTMLE